MAYIEIRLVKKYFTAKSFAIKEKKELSDVRKLIANGTIQVDFPNCHEKVIDYENILKIPTQRDANELANAISNNPDTNKAVNGMITFTPKGLFCVG